MGNLHELALFWRDEQSRCVTLLHFSPQRQTALARAKKIAAALQSLSTLQLYGAALDGESLEVSANTVAPMAGTEKRLEIELYPAEKVNARMGITYMRVTVPAPMPALAAAVSKGRFQSPEWQLLDTELFPFLKLPVGVGVTAKTGKARVFKALLLELKEERRPQPGQSPLATKLADAIKRCEESKQMEAARRKQGDYTPRDSERVKKFQEQIKRFERLAAIEARLFTELVTQPGMAKPQALTATATPSSPITEESPTIMEQPEITLTASASVEPLEAAAPQSAISTDYHFLPVSPAPGSAEAQLWQDVPSEHFADPQFWTNVFLVKAESGISQRTYFRLLEKLKEHGLSRSLPADVKRKGVLPLYYRPDWDQAMQRAGERKPERGRTARALAAVATASQAAESAEPALAAAAHTGKDSGVATVPALSAINDSLEKLTKTITDFQERFQSQISSLHDQVQSLSQRQDQLDSSLTKGIASLPAVDALSQLLTNLAAATQTGSATPLNSPTPAKAARGETSIKFLTVSQAAQLINKDPSNVRRACERKFYKAKKVNGYWQIDREDFYRKHKLK